MRPMAEVDANRANWAFSSVIANAERFYSRLLECIGNAAETVDFEYYIFELDALGKRFVDALGEAAARGVRVRVLVDGVGSAAGSEVLAHRLFELGVAVQIYHPLPWLTRSFRWSQTRGGLIYKFMTFLLNVNRRNHRKLCVVDGKLAWVGSFNISSDHLPVDGGGRGWRDYALELRGQGVDSLAEGFDRLWTARLPRLGRGFIARYLSNRSNRARRLKNRFVADSVRSVSRRVWLVSAYFAPTAQLRRALLAACKQGRDIRLLLPEQSDVAVFPGLSSHYYRELLHSGARIFLYQSGVLHAKALLVDGLSIVGSSNWNYRSTLHDLELDVLVDERATVEAIERIIEQDMRNSRELLLEHVAAPRLASWIWYLLRYWM